MSRSLLALIAALAGLALAGPAAAARVTVCPSGACDPAYCEASPVIRGTAGPDVLSGTARRDVVVARAGDDVVDVRGGGRDVVTCGAGRDTVRVDKRDSVAASCERVAQG